MTASEVGSTLEVERKFRVHGLFHMPDLEAVDGVAEVRERPTLHLAATYFDTADLRLVRSGVTLRRREGGVDDGWHLKLPSDAAPEAREELSLPLTRSDTPPEAFAELILAIRRGATLGSVATLQTDRDVRELLDAEGRVLAEVTDDSVSVVDDGKVAARFRELEVELADGSPEILDAVEAVVAAAGAVQGGYLSKAARALGPQAAAPPDIPPAPEPTKDGPARLLIEAHVVTQVTAIVAQDLRVRRELPDAVHQMRVACRRLRSSLKVFRPLLDETWAESTRAELSWLADELGGVRDREVLRKRLLGAIAEMARSRDHLALGAAAALVERALTDQEAAARVEMIDALRSPRYVALLETLVDATHGVPVTEAADEPAGEVVPPLVAKAWRRLARRVSELDAGSDDHAWHLARIAAKQCRYACEAAVPVFGKPAKRLASATEEVTELLGAHQDSAVAEQTLRELAGLPRNRLVTRQAVFGLGLLYAGELAAAAHSREEFWEIWPEVSRKSLRRWLDGSGS